MTEARLGDVRDLRRHLGSALVATGRCPRANWHGGVSGVENLQHRGSRFLCTVVGPLTGLNFGLNFQCFRSQPPNLACLLHAEIF